MILSPQLLNNLPKGLKPHSPHISEKEARLLGAANPLNRKG
jgi:hypothetical protein